MKKTIFFTLILSIVFIACPLFGVNSLDRDIYYLTVSNYTSYRSFISGVQFYNDERYEASIENFKNALNYNPSDKLIRYWYSRALYQGGYNDLAINEWENLIRMGENDLIIQSKLNKYGSILAQTSTEEVLSNFIHLGAFSRDVNFLKNINQPIDLKVHRNGNIYVLDYSAGALKVFNVNGMQISKIDYGIQPVAEQTILTKIRSFPILNQIPWFGLKAELQKPRSFDFDESGNIYIANTGSDIIYKYDSNHSYVTNIGSAGYEEGQLSGPSGIYIYDGKMYVADTGNNRISIFTLDGEYLSSFGKMGADPGEFFRPYSIAVNEEFIFVADAGNRRVQKFDRFGRYIETLSIALLGQPYFVGFAYDGNLFIADGQRVFYHNIYEGNTTVFQNSTRYTATPTSVYESHNGEIYITDFLSGNIDVYIEKESYYVNLDVFLNRTYLSEYPGVVHKITVEDSELRPITGLTAENFAVYQDDIPIPKVDFYIDSAMDEYRFIYVIDNSLMSGNYSDRMSEEIVNFTTALTGTDEVLTIHFNDNIKVVNGFENRNLRIINNSTNFTSEGTTSSFSFAMHEAIRLASNSLKKTAIIVFSAADISDTDFSNRSYSELMNYSKNIGVPISVVYVGDSKGNYFLDTMASYTQGRTMNADVSIDYGAQLQYLKTRDFGIYYVRYNLNDVVIDHKKGYYTGVRVVVNYRDMYGEEETGYIIP